MLVAVGEDDVNKLRSYDFKPEELVHLRFEEGMNVLNLAIDQMRIKIVMYLATIMNDQQKETLVEHTYLGIKAIHQAISLGNLKILNMVVNDFDGDLTVVAKGDISVLHFAA